MLRAPFSSEFDPSEEAEGSIDPLGLQPGYERLADRLLPAVTVRMGHPRFVTAMAVGACVTSTITPTPPDLVETPCPTLNFGISPSLLQREARSVSTIRLTSQGLFQRRFGAFG